MNLYRIDILAASGSRPLCDIFGTRLIRSHTVAVAAAKDAASVNGCPTLLTRIKGAGIVTAMRAYNPDGSSERVR